jgi:hypothetical protein
MNAIIGVIVSRTAEAARAAEEQEIHNFREMQMEHVECLKDLIYEMDEDGSGTVSADDSIHDAKATDSHVHQQDQC